MDRGRYTGATQPMPPDNAPAPPCPCSEMDTPARRRPHSGHDLETRPVRFTDPLPKHAGFSTEQQGKVVTDYYVEEGWDAVTGAPTADTIRALGIEEDAARAV